MNDARSLVRYVQGELGKLADPVKAVPMAAYMKTDMPFYGVSKPDRVPIAREVKARFPPADAERLPHEGAVPVGPSTSGGEVSGDRIRLDVPKPRRLRPDRPVRAHDHRGRLVGLRR